MDISLYDDPLAIGLSVLFAVIGFCYMIYGRREQHLWFIIAGLGLMVYTLVTTNLSQMIWAGIILIVLPFILETLF